MMLIAFEIDQNWLKNTAQLTTRMKSKKDVVLLLLSSMTYMQYARCMAKPSTHSVCLYENKMRRLFFFLDRKYFSITFPFYTDTENGQLRFFCEGIEVDSKMISWLTALFNCLDEKNILLDWMDVLDGDEVSEEEIENFSKIIIYLLKNEDGYIRYDYDKKNNLPNGRMHPWHHFDVFYSQKNTFKIGLYKELTYEQFLCFLNNQTERFFIENSSRK